MIPIPIPSVGDALAAVPAVRKWWDERQQASFLEAWRGVPIDLVYDAVCQFYASQGVPLVTYPHITGRANPVPVYSRPEWMGESVRALQPTLNASVLPFTPTSDQQQFWARFREFKRTETDGEWPRQRNEVYRLVTKREGPQGLELSFALGSFPHSVMCQYVLESETRLSLTGKADINLPIRAAVARTPSMLDDFLVGNVVRIGICTLILLRRNDDAYLPLVYKRSALTMAQSHLLDCISSCIFEVATHALADLELRHTVLREINEELYGSEEVIYRSNRPDPAFFYKDPPIRDLVRLLSLEGASFVTTGFCLDLVRMVPEITCVLVVRDPKYLRDHESKFNLGAEFQTSAGLSVPRRLVDVDEFVASEVPRSPDDRPLVRGFDPLRWTLPSAFAFYHGLKRATALDLL